MLPVPVRGQQLCLCLPKHCQRSSRVPAVVRLPWWECLRLSCGFGCSPVLVAASLCNN